MEPKPLKTFRTEFSIYEQSATTTYISSPDRYVFVLIILLRYVGRLGGRGVIILSDVIF